MKKFLIADDHMAVRSGIRYLLADAFMPCEIDEATNGNEVIEKLKTHNYYLIVMDIQMPNTDTLSLMEFIHIKYPDSKVAIYSMNPERIYAKRFLKAGAKGFISKAADFEEVLKAIKTIFLGKIYISEELANILAEDSFSDSGDNPFNQLSSREFEVATLLLTGKSMSEISKSLNLQMSTVGTYKVRVFEKLDVTNVIELKDLAASFNF